MELGPNIDAAARPALLGAPLDPMTMAEAVTCAEQAMAERGAVLMVSLNVAKLIQMRSDANVRATVLGADYVTADGAGAVWGARLCGIEVPERVAGIDLLEECLQLCDRSGYRPYLLGATPDVLDQAIERIRTRYPKLELAGRRHGYFSPDEEMEIVEDIRSSGADCLFVGISSPLSERFFRHHGAAHVPFALGVGGSFDVLAGRTRRAPAWVQRMGFEWAYRLAQEPRRLGWRYLSTNVAYATLLVPEILRQRWNRTRQS